MATSPLVIPVSKVRSSLSGSGLSDTLAILGDSAAQDKVLTSAVKVAQSRVEKRTDTLLTQKVIKSRPVEAGLVRGTDYDIVESPYNFYRDDFNNFGRLRLLRRPIVSVERLMIRFGEGVTVFAPPAPWVDSFIDSANGTIHVVPYIGGLNVGPVAAIGLIPLYLGLRGHPQSQSPSAMVPQIVSVDYTAGFLPKDFDAASDDLDEASPDHDVQTLVDAVRCLAAAIVLEDLAPSFGVQGGSLSFDGFSQSIQSNQLDGVIKAFSDKADAYIQEFNASGSILMESL